MVGTASFRELDAAIDVEAVDCLRSAPMHPPAPGPRAARRDRVAGRERRRGGVDDLVARCGIAVAVIRDEESVDASFHNRRHQPASGAGLRRRGGQRRGRPRIRPSRSHPRARNAGRHAATRHHTAVEGTERDLEVLRRGFHGQDEGASARVAAGAWHAEPAGSPSIRSAPRPRRDPVTEAACRRPRCRARWRLPARSSRRRPLRDLSAGTRPVCGGFGKTQGHLETLETVLVLDESRADRLKIVDFAHLEEREANKLPRRRA